MFADYLLVASKMKFGKKEQFVNDDIVSMHSKIIRDSLILQSTGNIKFKSRVNKTHILTQSL